MNGLRLNEQHRRPATIGDTFCLIRDNRATTGAYNSQQEVAWCWRSLPFPSMRRVASPNFRLTQENVMKKLTLGLSVAAFALAGAAYAAPTATNNGTLTRAEAQAHATEMFAKMDANKDGKLDSADRQARQNARFDRIDTNKDGQISREEFSARHPARAQDGTSSATAKPERKHDSKHRMGHHGRKGWSGHGRMMRAADTDKDGAISQAEFTASALQRFDSLDANKDGQVTKEERQAAFKAMRDKARSRTAAPAAPAAPAASTAPAN